MESNKQTDSQAAVQTAVQTAIIIGAGPAGLTAAYELLKKTKIRPVIYEADEEIGGISRTKEYKGNRMDIGGHRFFSKSDRVTNFWNEIMPTENPAAGISPNSTDLLFLVRHRLSRILYLRRFFDYPVSLNGDTIRGLGLKRLMKIGFSYLGVCLRPVKNVDSLEQFFISRFGKELYETFFKDYTEKVWGVPCSQISPDWGAQRVKGLSVSKALLHALAKPFTAKSQVNGKKVETSLIERFSYPKYGPGQLWEEVARRVVEMGGEIHLGCRVTGVACQEGRINAVTVTDKQGQSRQVCGDYFFSTMPVADLVAAMGPAVPGNVRQVASGLVYRDFMTVGLLLKSLALTDPRAPDGRVLDDWIYVQEKDVKVGRLQIFNNWSPYMVKDPNTVFLGLEYFCNEGDEMWTMADGDFIAMAQAELEKLGVIRRDQVLDATLIRMPKAYPAYFGSYGRFDEIRRFTDGFANLFLIGRNGQHRYNNMDHSMLTAMEAVDAVAAGRPQDKAAVWAVNTEKDYHEEGKNA